MTREEARALYVRIWRENTVAEEKLRSMARRVWARQGKRGADITDTPETDALYAGASACEQRARDAVYELHDRGGLLMAVLR